MAIVTSNVNVKFNSVLDDVVVLRTDGATKQTVVLWNTLSAADQALLTSIINDLGGDAPLAAPVAGYAKLQYAGNLTGTDATGLDSLAAASSGKATVNFSSAKTGSSASGLTVSGSATAGYQTVTINPAFISANTTGLADDSDEYTATITVDGVAKSISVVGSAAQTITDLLAEINADLGASAVASLNAGSIRVTSATTGASSSVAIVDGDLFATAAIGVIGTAVAGVAATGSSKKYTAVVEIDGVSKSVSFTGGAGVTLADVATEIDNDLGAAASVAVSGGALVITATSTGPSSRVRVFDTGWLFSNLTDFAGVTYSDGANPVVYTATFEVDGVQVPVSVQGSDAQTFADLVTEVNTDLGVAATAAIVGSAIVVTSATTGATSKVVLVKDGLFSKTAGFASRKSVNGATDLVEALSNLWVSTSASYLDYFSHNEVPIGRPVKPVAGSVPKNIKNIYWGGAGPDWRYFNDDSTV